MDGYDRTEELVCHFDFSVFHVGKQKVNSLLT